MNRQAQAVVMLLLGGAILKVSIGDLYLRYVKESLQPFLIGAGVLLIVAAAMTLWYDLRHGSAVDTECADDHDSDGVGAGGAIAHDHTPHREPRVGWMLIAPVLGLLLVAPPALGAFAAGQSGSALSSQETDDFPPLPDGDPAEISVLDYATRAIFDKGLSIGDRKVKVTGFISYGPDGQPILTRMILSCCAADGRPIKVGMAGDVPSGLSEDSWVQVVGKYTDRTGEDPVNGERIPFIEVVQWTQVEPPRNQYE